MPKMPNITEKIAVVEFYFTLEDFMDEWNYYNDEEPTQADYDEWVQSVTYETLTDPDYSPTVKLTEA